MKGGFSVKYIDELFHEIKEKEILEIETWETETVEMETLETEIVETESWETESIETKTWEIKKVEINTIEMESLERETVEPKQLKTEFTMNKEKQKRIEDMIFAGIKKEELSSDNKNDVIKLENKKYKKKFLVFILAAAFLLSMTVFAAEKNEWDIAIVNFMGISNADTVQLKDGVVEIGVSALSSGVTMKAVTSVGDKNSVYIRIDTDYKLPKAFNEKTDYIIPDNWDITITNRTMNQNNDHSGSLQYFNNNGFLSFMMYIGNCSGINKKNVSVSFGDLYLYHDLGADENTKVDHGTLLLKGKWDLSWKYSYRSNVDTYYPMKQVISNGEKCLVTKIEISPLTIRAESIKNPHIGSTESSKLLINKITLKDGTEIKFNPESTSGGCKNNIFLEGYRDVLEMGKAINPAKVFSITIGDTEIKLR